MEISILHFDDDTEKDEKSCYNVPSLDCTYSLCVTGSLVHDHLHSIHVANKICLSYVTNIPKVMGLECGTFVVSYLKTLDMPFLRLFFF